MDCCQNKVTLLQKLKVLLKSKNIKEDGFNEENWKVALIGNPNVGKSVIFNSLTGAYVTVSNYPGTTVEVSRGWHHASKGNFEIIDTPGMYSILPITEEERVTRSLLVNEKPDLVIHVIDAKNIERMLPMTLQLLEAGFRVLLVLNIMDEAKSLGMEINVQELSRLLNIPVMTASAALNVGMTEVRECMIACVEEAA